MCVCFVFCLHICVLALNKKTYAVSRVARWSLLLIVFFSIDSPKTGLKLLNGQAYCSYWIRETLITNGGRPSLVSRRKTLTSHLTSSMEEGTKLVCRKTLMHINKGKAHGRKGKAPNRHKNDPLWLLPSWVSLIEDRYQIYHVPRENRLCPLYKLNHVESENRCLFNCTKYSSQRQAFLNKLNEIVPDIKKESPSESIKLLINSNDYQRRLDTVRNAPW